MKLKSKFVKGLMKGLLYYASGSILVYVVYLIFGWEYIHAPGFHHIIGFLFFVGGVVFLLRNLVFLVAGKREKIDFGFLLINVITLASVIIYFSVDIRNSNVADEYKTDPKDIITINTRDSAGASSMVNGNGDTLYLRNDDSVLINKISKDSNAK